MPKDAGRCKKKEQEFLRQVSESRIQLFPSLGGKEMQLQAASCAVARSAREPRSRSDGVQRGRGRSPRRQQRGELPRNRWRRRRPVSRRAAPRAAATLVPQHKPDSCWMSHASRHCISVLSKPKGSVNFVINPAQRAIAAISTKKSIGRVGV